jgi:DNA-binding transcriptional regulator YdaS (Cro superfamily)
MTPMTLKDFLRKLGSDEERAAFAVRCGTTLKYLRIVAYSATKRRSLGAELCIYIERESHHQVTVEVLRPDIPWHVIRGAKRRNKTKPNTQEKPE